MITRSRSLVAALAAASLVVAACGDDDEEPAAEEPAAEEPAEEPAEDTTAATEPAPEDTATEETEPAPEDTTAGTEPAPADTTEGTEPPAASVEGTLVIWADEQRTEVLQDVVPAFTDATGVEVQIELVPFDDIREQVTQAAPAGEGPDLFAGAHDWTGELAANGIIEPIDLTAKQDQFIEQAVQVFGFEGQNYAVPYATEAIALYRNTDLVPDAPATWEDLTAACDEAGAPTCLALPGGGTATDAYHQYPFISGFDGYVFAYDEASGFDPADVGLDSEGAVEGATYLDGLVSDGYLPSTDYDTAKNLFLGGEAAFWSTGPWELNGLRDQGDVNWDVSVLPEFTEGGQAEPFVGGQGFFLSSFSPNSLLAQSFLLDFVATDETQQALYDADPRGAAWVAVQEGLADDPQAQVFSDAVASGTPMPNIPQMGQVWDPLGENLLLLRNGEQGPEAAMSTAAEAVRAAVTG